MSENFEMLAHRLEVITCAWLGGKYSTKDTGITSTGSSKTLHKHCGIWTISVPSLKNGAIYQPPPIIRELKNFVLWVESETNQPRMDVSDVYGHLVPGHLASRTVASPLLPSVVSSSPADGGRQAVAAPALPPGSLHPLHISLGIPLKCARTP